MLKFSGNNISEIDFGSLHSLAILHRLIKHLVEFLEISDEVATDADIIDS